MEDKALHKDKKGKKEKRHLKALLDVEPENYWEQMERLERLIRASELKAGIIFSFHSLVIGVFFDRMEVLSETFHNSSIFTILVVLWLFIVFVSIFFALQCFIPKMELKFDKNVFFFKDAVNNFGDVHQYSKKLMNTVADREELFDQLGQQIYIESKIVDTKFKSVKKAMKFMAYSFIFVILIMVLWLLQLKDIL
ncbi:Pycsar system effector family protein [Robertkochia flava]|uniref:Pycsar system effector family protein n=1 Tax=Robertkochia flava TaxID=3447986 RepID=UPI001CD014F7|nr:Pycsar system effector family protein [Robertkochia marina]